MSGHAFGQMELLDVQGFGFSHGADDGMEGLLVRERMNAVHAAGELHKLIPIFCRMHPG
ncbi:MAG: hypothetical protein JWQ71_1532, partial [Pedosphaera sp.]|nr:hypothetical protein [Pedosphaera sp.]